MEYNLENYEKKVAEIELEASIRKRNLIKEFALANNPYKVGDIISDHYKTIQIEAIKVSGSFGRELPCCSYSGIELKKDGTPKVRQSGETIWQNNIIEIF